MARIPHLYGATFAFILNQENKLLLQQRQNTWYYDGGRQLPSGHIDEGETAIESMRHECLEELGITVHIDESHVFHILHRLNTDRQYFDVGCIITDRSWEIINNEPEKCSQLEWFPLDNIPEHTSPSTIIFIKAYLSGQKYSEYRE